MKRRILAALCALALCLGLLTLSMAVGAAGNPCFVAVNDNLLPLEEQYIPITVSGQYYVPYTVLDSGVTGISLGIYPIYNSITNTLMIYKWEQTLTFDLSKNTCTDRKGNTQNARAVIRDGRIYIPARFTSEYFGLSYSSRNTTYGPLIRIYSSAAYLDDNNFVSAAQQQMESRLRDWRRAQAAATTPEVTPTPTITPTLPTPTPFSPPAVTEPPERDKSDVRTYLAFRADETDGLTELLSRLEQYQLQALFFFPAAELADYDDAVRAVLCGGHMVGLLVSGADGEETAAQAEQGNRLLAQIAHLDARVVLAAGPETAAALQTMTETGLLCWPVDENSVDALPDGRGASARANEVLAQADGVEEKLFLLSDASAAGAALMGRVLPELIGDSYDLRLAVETELTKNGGT